LATSIGRRWPLNPGRVATPQTFHCSRFTTTVTPLAGCHRTARGAGKPRIFEIASTGRPTWHARCSCPCTRIVRRGLRRRTTLGWPRSFPLACQSEVFDPRRVSSPRLP